MKYINFFREHILLKSHIVSRLISLQFNFFTILTPLMQDSDNNEFVQIKLKTEQLSIEYSQLCKHSQLAQEKSIYYHESNL